LLHCGVDVDARQIFRIESLTAHRRREKLFEHLLDAFGFDPLSPQCIDGIAWPTGEQALEEERSERHAGLYWVDLPDSKGETMRLFLPNYFNTFCELLRGDTAYSNLIGNRGTVLELLGRRDEARLHFEEAAEFHAAISG